MVLATAFCGGTAGAQTPDLLSFAQGAIPLRVEADPAARVTIAHAIKAIDGSPSVFVLTRPVPASSRIALFYELPAVTVFERLAVPNVLETPSPTQTFVREVAVWGSAVSATDGFVKLASATLTVHKRPGEETVLTLLRRDPVRWVRLDLSDGLDVPQPARAVALEFSEIIGHGRQEAVPMASGFGGGWKGRGLALALQQQGPVVTGCYDNGEGRLQGTVDGRLLRATGTAIRTGVPSAFMAALRDDGALQVMQSTNGAPFYLFEGGAAGQGAIKCAEPARPALGCGSVIHGIRFDFDSATIRPESAPVLQALYDGLAQDRSARIGIEGHTSSEGEAAYNQQLSQRRAQAVVDDLVRRGLALARLSASGAGESKPVAPNDDETGRSLNRRVEVRCAA
jgi:OOP family OmpA-OmpF porin